MVKQYVGARYVPKFATPVEWAADTSYEALTIVTFNNASYTSKVPVPPTVGNPANNPQYWALTGNYNAQVEQYRQETENYNAQVEQYRQETENYNAQVEEYRQAVTEIVPKTQFYTPEMFGAKGDDITNDGNAVQQCIDAAVANNSTAIMCNSYNLSNTQIIIHGSLNIIGGGDFTYTGSDSAFVFESCQNTTFSFNSITSASDGIIFDGDNGFNQYINIYGNSIKANTNCIKFVRSVPGKTWSNETRIYGVGLHCDYTANPLTRETCGVLIDVGADLPIDSISLICCGFERCKYGVKQIPSTSGHSYCTLNIISPRFLEEFTYALYLEGLAGVTLINTYAYANFDYDNIYYFSNDIEGNLFTQILKNGNIVSNSAKILHGKVYVNGNPARMTYGSTPVTNINNTYVAVTISEITINLSEFWGTNGLNELHIFVTTPTTITITLPNGTTQTKSISTAYSMITAYIQDDSILFSSAPLL